MQTDLRRFDCYECGWTTEQPRIRETTGSSCSRHNNLTILIERPRFRAFLSSAFPQIHLESHVRLDHEKIKEDVRLASGGESSTAVGEICIIAESFLAEKPRTKRRLSKYSPVSASAPCVAVLNIKRSFYCNRSWHPTNDSSENRVCRQICMRLNNPASRIRKTLL